MTTARLLAIVDTISQSLQTPELCGREPISIALELDDWHLVLAGLRIIPDQVASDEERAQLEIHRWVGYYAAELNESQIAVEDFVAVIRQREDAVERAAELKQQEKKDGNSADNL